MERTSIIPSIPSPTKAIPIPIPQKTYSIPELDEYSLKQNFFDPNKSTPPNSWDNRLRARLSNYLFNIS